MTSRVDTRESLFGALRRLDDLLDRAVAAASAAQSLEAFGAHSGLYVTAADAARLLRAREPGAPLLSDARVDDGFAPQVERLGALFGLDGFDLDVVLLALAPEVDTRYERVFGYLHDDITRRRPSVGLALDLLCATAAAKLAARERFGAGAPLLRSEVVRVVADPTHVEPPLIVRYLKLDEQVVRYLLGDPSLDERLAPFCELVTAPRAGSVPPGAQASRLLFHGPEGGGKRAAAEARAAAAAAPLLAADVSRLGPGEIAAVAGALFREARLRGAVLYVAGVDALREPDRTRDLRTLVDALRRHDGTVVLSTRRPWRPVRAPGEPVVTDVVAVPFAVPSAAERAEAWRAALARSGAAVSADDVVALAARFRLTPGQIDDAAAAAVGATHAPPSRDDLFAAARAQSEHGLAALATKVVPHYAWEDIVLPRDRLEQLRELCDQVRHRALVYEQWGFDRRLSLGKGLTALFAGPSGTGKTMAAEIVAAELGLDLYKIDLSAVVSKYIGETEKNLSRIFAEAEATNAILFFDEADALFGKRSEVRDSHDRYANLEISYLLQRIDEYEGIVVLATNLRKNMDDAFARRMQITVEFPFPDAADRRRIWRAIWPLETPRADTLDLDDVARRFELAGGSIRNIAVAAAFLAAADGRVVTTEHVLRATRREYQKLGKVVGDAEFDA